MVKLNKTITTIFMVPTLKIGKENLDNNKFINGFIKDVNKPDYEDCVFLLFKPEDLDNFASFLEEQYDNNPQIIEDYDYEDGYVVIVYKLDVNFYDDFNLIKQSKYSKTSKEFQELFPKAVKIFVTGVNGKSLHRDEVSLQFRIFRKSKDLLSFWEEKINIIFEEIFGEEPNYEVWEGFDEKKETLNINNYIKKEEYEFN